MIIHYPVVSTGKVDLYKGWFQYFLDTNIPMKSTVSIAEVFIKIEHF